MENMDIVLSERAKELLSAVYQSYDNGEESCAIKLPRGSEIHGFNMALKELAEGGYIEIVDKNLTRALLELTNEGLELCLEVL
jgi:deoxyxylulose-5-phosphate synthase